MATRRSAALYRLWALAAAGYPGHERYRTRTSRTIPVVVLEPAGA